MKVRSLSLAGLAGYACVIMTLGCSSTAVQPAPRSPAPGAPTAPSPGPGGPAARPAPAAVAGPIGERAQGLREAAGQLDKAATALARGNRNLAEQLFSTAELLVGPEALAGIAEQFRAGAPPRVTTPTVKVDPGAAPQPKAAGSSEADDEVAKVAPPRAVGSLSGTLQIEGQGAGALGLVTLEPASGKWKPRTPKQVVVEQRGREFFPRLVAVAVGSTVTFPNFDTVFHNVFSTTAAAPFDLGLYKAGEAREYTFSREGIVRLGCNLHANMSAYIAVVAAPAYVVTDDQGRFAFRRLAPGKYKLRAWTVRSKAPITQDITIKAGANELSVGVAADAPGGPQPDKFGGKRG